MTELTERTLLLVDDEENILRSLKRLFRPDGYQILQANSGIEGLEVLKEHKVGVILSDQRMPGMNGTEFLKQAKELCPNSIRLVLSGFADLESIATAINEGSIYKFLTKPWDDELLRSNIEEAFEYHELKIHNDQLTEELQLANSTLTQQNDELKTLAEDRKQLMLARSEMLNSFQKIMDCLPVPLLALDNNGTITLQNQSLIKHLSLDVPAVLGLSIDECLPSELTDIINPVNSQKTVEIKLKEKDYYCYVKIIEQPPALPGKLVVLIPK